MRIKDKGAALLAAIIALATGLSGAAAQERVLPQSQGQVVLSYAPLVEAVAPAVVNIYAEKMVQSRAAQNPLFNDPFFRHFFGDNFGMPRQRRENSLGSGVIVSGDGTVVTNHHVIADADEIRVVLRDRREFDAEIVLSDERTDLAVLRLIDPRGPLPTVTLGDSDAIAVGDLVLAIGNPFGVGQTVTGGIVSGLARTSVDVSDYQSFIQTDAAINPGNSGGALVAMDGRVIGINTAIFSRSGGSHGIGFAVPANMVAAILRTAETGEPLVRPWLGLSGRAVDWDMAAALGMPAPHGVIVEELYPGGPAERAGLRGGDIVLDADGVEIRDLRNLRFRAATLGIGAVLPMTVLRGDDKLRIELPLTAPPEEPAPDPVVVRSGAPFAGAEFVNLSPAMAVELGLERIRDGVMARRIARNSPAARLGFRPGDILVSINGVDVEQTSDVRRILQDPPRRWRLVIDRDGQRRSVDVR
jgi:serine protease Do